MANAHERKEQRCPYSNQFKFEDRGTEGISESAKARGKLLTLSSQSDIIFGRVTVLPQKGRKIKFRNVFLFRITAFILGYSDSIERISQIYRAHRFSE